MKLTLKKEIIKSKGKNTRPSGIQLPKKDKSIFSRISSGLLRLFAFIIPTALLIGGIPYAIVQGSDLLQPFFKATNFTIGSTTNAFSTIKQAPELRHDGNGVTNILLVGIDTRPGTSHLRNTDTMILASYNHATNEVSMLSFPRDLNVTYPNTYSYGKINATYSYGEQRKSGTGMEYLRQLIESITGQKIQYHAMIDLQGFITIVDQLGGVDVVVDTAFTGHYPLFNYKWTNVKFDKGLQHMDGNHALQFSRVRYAYPGSEASDFARARRQQKVIAAVIDKATKVETLQNTKAIFDILKTVSSNIKINRITPEDIEAGLVILSTKGKPTTYSMVLDPAAGGSYARLITRGPGHLYNLQPSAGANNWSAVKNFVKIYFEAPMLATNSKAVYFYNAGKKDFNKTVSNLQSKFYYANIKNGGAPTNLPAPGVYAVGGSAFDSTCKYFASYYKASCNDISTTETALPKPKDTGIIIILKD